MKPTDKQLRRDRRRSQFKDVSRISILVGMAAVVSFLYLMTQQSDQENYQQAIEEIRDMQKTDAQLKRDILQVRLGLISVDQLFSNSENMERTRLQTQLEELRTAYTALTSSENEFALTEQPIEMMNHELVSMGKMLDDSEGLVRSFVEDNKKFLRSLERAPEQAAAIKANIADVRRQNSALAGTMDDLEAQLDELLDNVLLFNVTSDESLRTPILDSRARATSLLQTPGVPDSLRDQARSLLTETKTIVDRKPVVEGLIRALMLTPTTEQINRIEEMYVRYNQETVLTLADAYGTALFIATALLIFYVLFFIIRLRVAAKQLREANDQLEEANETLEDKVRRRTAALQAKNEEMLFEMKVANEVQMSLLPEQETISAAAHLYSSLQPMTSVSGDYYDVFELRENVYAILVADVSGHGVPSALVTTMVKVAFFENTIDGRHPAEVIQIVNDTLSPVLEATGMYFTAFFGVLDLTKGEFNFSNAGHNAAILHKRDDDIVQPLDSNGPIIGVMTGLNFLENRIHVGVNDRLVLFTDGITEAKNPKSQMYDDPRLIEAIQAGRMLDAKTLHDAILKDVEDFCDGRDATDDRTLMVIDIKDILAEKKPEPDEAEYAMA